MLARCHPNANVVCGYVLKPSDSRQPSPHGVYLRDAGPRDLLLLPGVREWYPSFRSDARLGFCYVDLCLWAIWSGRLVEVDDGKYLDITREEVSEGLTFSTCTSSMISNYDIPLIVCSVVARSLTTW